MLKEIIAGTCLLSGMASPHSFAADDRAICENELAGPSRSILSIGYYPAQRDAIDLAKFLNWKLDVAGVGSIRNKGQKLNQKPWYWPARCGMNDEEAADMIRNKLRNDYDIVLMTPRPAWDKYPQDIRTKLVDKTRSGSVLAVFQPGKDFLKQFDRKLLKELPIYQNIFKPLDQKDSFSPILYQYGKGIIAICRSPIDYRFGFLFRMSPEKIYYKYRMARTACFLNHLVQRSSGQVSSLSADSKAVQVELSNPNGTSMSLKIFNNDGAAEKELTQDLRNGTAKYDFKLPPLPNGRHFVFLSLLDSKNKILDWSASWFTTKNKSGIKTVKVTPETVTPGTPVKVSLECFGKFATPVLKITVSDNWGRICLPEKKSGNINEFEFNAPENSCTVINKVNLKLYDGKTLIENKTIEFTIPQNIARQDFYLFCWNSGGRSYRQKHYFDAMKDFGVDGFSNTGRTKKCARIISEANLIGIPYTTVFHGVTLQNHLFNKKWITKMVRNSSEAVKHFKPYGAFAFTLGDENYVSGFKPEGRFVDTPELWKEFQKILQEQYSSLNALNSQWESSYNDWQNIRFKSEDELLNKYGNPSAWVDFREFISMQFIGLQKKMRDIIKTTCPDAYVGWDGAEQYSGYDGYDWWKYTTEFDLNNIYCRYFLPGGYSSKIFNGYCVKSFSKKDNLKGAWLNTVEPIFGIKFAPWNLLFNGFNSVWWWRATFLGYEVAAFDPYLQPTPIFRDAAEQVMEIKAGPGTMLKHAVPEASKIAVHYSVNNWYASTLSSGIGGHINNLGTNQELWFSQNMSSRLIKCDNSFKKLWKDAPVVGHYAAASKNVIYLLEDLGLNPSILARQQIEAGMLKNYKVLFLPFVESLSDKEAEKIKEFVKNGGTVIADYRCGIRDLHCKFRKNGILDEVFGIEQSGKFDVLKKRRKTTIDDCRLTAEFDIIFSQTEIKLTSGIAGGVTDDGSPAFIKNKYGKGKALYCNFDLYAYFNERLKQQEAPVRELFAKFLVINTGFCREPRVRRDDGNLGGQTCIRKFTDGNAFYMGVSRDFLSPQARIETLNIPMGRCGHIYEIRSKRYWGYGNSAIITMKPGESVLFAVMPYKPGAPKLTGPKSATAGSTVEFKVQSLPEDSNGKVQPSTVNIEVFDNTGKKRSYLSKVVYLKNGSGTFKLPFAYNDKPGKWLIKLTETISGKTMLFDFSLNSI